MSATAPEGPPMSVVPVSMAAYDEDPEGKEIELPFTFSAGHGESEIIRVGR